MHRRFPAVSSIQLNSTRVSSPSRVLLHPLLTCWSFDISLVPYNVEKKKKKAALVLARSTTTARLASSALSAPAATATATAAKKRDAEERESRRRCPDALLVRAVEALGRVYMHREAALSSGGGAAATATAAAPQEGGGAAEEQLQQAEEMSMLQPMSFSVKMRELVVWATNTVLPVLVGGGGSGGLGVDMAEGGGGTPGELSVHVRRCFSFAGDVLVQCKCTEASLYRLRPRNSVTTREVVVGVDAAAGFYAG